MPNLDWIGKDAVLTHHKDVPYRLLQPVDELSTGDLTAGNLIIQGDNLHALKAILPRWGGRVKCIYIDPPYNTGNENWIYNDNVNSPEIRKWLNQVVGKEGEDLSRHDKWLCMMYPRLTLLKQFLSEDGVILVSIDDNEAGALKLLLDEIFGRVNHLGTLVWEKGKKGDAKFFSVTHEYILAYARRKAFLTSVNTKWRLRKRGIDRVLKKYQDLRSELGSDHVEIRARMMAWYRSLESKDSAKKLKHYNWSDDRGLYFAADFAGPDDGRKNRPRYDIPHPVTKKPVKKPATGWRWEEPRTEAALADNPPRIHFGPDETTIPCRKSYLIEVDSEPFQSVFYKDGRAATRVLDGMFGRGSFDFPKDHEILSDLIKLVTKKDSIVLDSFAGSGTTGHAVLHANDSDGGARKFIMVELEEEVALTRTAPRMSNVINGYTDTNGNTQQGLGGGFQYCRLSEKTLFDSTGKVAEHIKFADLAEFVWFIETGTGYVLPAAKSPLIGIFDDVAIYLLFNGILSDISAEGGNVLTSRVFDSLPSFKGKKIIYAAANRMSRNSMARNDIVFRQTPYALEV